VSLRSNCHLLSHTESEAIAPTEILTSRPERLPFLNSVKCKFSDCIGRYPGSCHSGSDSGCRSICPVHVLYANIRWDILSMGRPAAVNQVRCWCHPPPTTPPPPEQPRPVTPTSTAPSPRTAWCQHSCVSRPDDARRGYLARRRFTLRTHARRSGWCGDD
jgi:hypothetical protein